MSIKFQLSSNDPDPVEIIEEQKPSSILLVCDHAGRQIPQALQNSPLAAIHMQRHIACDNGARQTAIRISRQLDAPLIMQRYSRLVVDPNRPTASEQSMPEYSDDTRIPFNQDIDAKHRQARLDQIYWPYHNRIRAKLDKMSSAGPVALVAIHSFTPYLRHGPFRIWHADLLARSHPQFAQNLQSMLQSELPQCNIGIGEVFQISDTTDFTLPYHGESRKIPNLSIEIRNDQLETDDGIQMWADILSRLIPRAILWNEIPA